MPIQKDRHLRSMGISYRGTWFANSSYWAGGGMDLVVGSSKGGGS